MKPAPRIRVDAPYKISGLTHQPATTIAISFVEHPAMGVYGNDYDEDLKMASQWFSGTIDLNEPPKPYDPMGWYSMTPAEQNAWMDMLTPMGPHYPSIYLRHFRVPALVVPVGICLAFLGYRFYARKFLLAKLKAMADAIEGERDEGTSSDEKTDSKEGLTEKQSIDKGVIDEEKLAKIDEPESKLLQLLRVLVQIFGLYHIMAIGDGLHPSSGFGGFTAIAEIIMLLATGYFLQREMLRAYAAQALGWLLTVVFYLNGSPGDHFVSLTIVLLAMLTICTFPREMDRVSSVPWFGAVNLITLVAQKVIPLNHPIRGLYFSHLELWSVALFIILITLGSISWKLRDSAGISGLAAAIKEEGSDSAHRVLTIGSMILVFSIVNLLVGYAASCMGFRWLLANTPATSPSAFDDAGWTTGFVFFAVIALSHLISAVRDPKVENEPELPTTGLILATVDRFACLGGWLLITLLSLSLTLRVGRDALGYNFTPSIRDGLNWVLDIIDPIDSSC